MAPRSALAYLADQFWDPQSSINLLKAIEVPQGQIQLVQKSALITGRLCCRMWTQQVIGGAAKRLPVKRQTSPWLMEMNSHPSQTLNKMKTFSNMHLKNSLYLHANKAVLFLCLPTDSKLGV